MTNSIRRPSLCAALTALVVLGACKDSGPDAFGNFEATEVTVAAEVPGRLVQLQVAEGDRVAAGAVVGSVDTIALQLERRELLAKRAAAASRTREVDANVASLKAQLDVAGRELARTERLLSVSAATAQQGDRAEREAGVIREQLTGAQAARATVGQEVAAIDAQLALLGDRLARSRVSSPLDGIVLARYAEPGEFVQPGQPLFKVASLDTLTLRAYVSGAQLSGVQLGAPVTVRIDRGDSLGHLPGRITWVASNAEFTPTPIQTKEERTEQVYAVKVAVPNSHGMLKIGMPGELVLEPAREER
jgi:HlyD family secretion protein